MSGQDMAYFCYSDRSVCKSTRLNKKLAKWWAFLLPEIKEKHMLQFFRKLFCLHAYEFDYDHEHGYTQECRKCGKDD